MSTLRMIQFPVNMVIMDQKAYNFWLPRANLFSPNWRYTWTGLDRARDTFLEKEYNRSFIILNEKSFWQEKMKLMNRENNGYMEKNSNFATLALLSLCFDFKKFFSEMTSNWVRFQILFFFLEAGMILEAWDAELEAAFSFGI